MFSPLDLFRTYGAPVALAAVAVIYVLDLRSDNRELRKDKAALELEVKGLEVEAAKNAAEIMRLVQAGQAVDATGTAQEARDNAELMRVRSSLTKLEQSLADLKTNPADDGSLGPDVTARLFEQRDAAAAILNARSGRDRPVSPASVPATPSASDGARDAAAAAASARRADGSNGGADSPLAIADAGMGREGLAFNDGLARSLAGPSAMPSPVTVSSIRCILSDVEDYTIDIRRPDGSTYQHTVSRSVKASDGTLTKWRGNWLTAWHVVDGPCIRILIDNEHWHGNAFALPDLDVAVLRWTGDGDCREVTTGETVTYRGFHLVAGDADNGLYDYDTLSGPVLDDRQINDPLPVAFEGVLVKSNSGGAVVDAAGELIGIAVEQSVDFDGEPLPVAWFSPMTEICKAMETRT